MLKIPGRIPISIHPFFWVLAGLIGWLNTANVAGTLIWTAIIIGSVLIHEFGHALTAIAFGQRAKIELMALGGMTYRKGPKRLQLWKEFLIVLNGPLAGFCLSGIAWVFLRALQANHPESLLTYVAEVTFYINLFWTILNLLPVQPLDGGKLLSIFLGSIFGVRGTKIALFLSMLIAGALSILFFILREFFIGSLFTLFTFESYKSWKESLTLSDDDENSELQLVFKEAEREMQRGNKEEALKQFLHIRNTTKGGMISQIASENAAFLLMDKGQIQQAYDLLAPLTKTLSMGSFFLLHRLSYELEHWEEALALGDRIYQNDRSYKSALMNAACNAKLGRVQPAIGWIQCAIHEGAPDLDKVFNNKKFDAIRNDPHFRELLAQHIPQQDKG